MTGKCLAHTTGKPTWRVPLVFEKVSEATRKARDTI